MERPDEKTRKRARREGFLEKATFRTTPEVTKLEVREFLEKVYGAPVVRVDTAIVQGELRKYNAQGKQRSVTVKASDYKKVFVTFAKGSIQQVEDGIRTRFSPKDAPSTLGMQLGS